MAWLRRKNSGAGPPKPKNRKRQAVIGIILLSAVIVAGLYLSSDSFADRVRLKVIAKLEEITGGRVELKQFRWKLSKLQFEADDLTIHGLEPPNAVPYAHADHLKIQVKIIALFSGEIGLRYAGFEHPVIHIMVFPDGSTNQPVPKVQREQKGTAIEDLFRLAMERFEMHDGLLLWNDRRIPFDLAGEQLKSTITYDAAGNKYDGNVQVARLKTKYKDYLPVLSDAAVNFSLRPSAVEVKTLRWSSDKSNFVAHGSLKDFADPKVELAYRGLLDLRQAGEILHIPPLRGGTLEADGEGRYSLKDFASSGKMLLHNLHYQDGSIDVAGVQGVTDFSVTPKEMAFRKLQLQAFGGSASGVANVLHWSTMPGEPGKSPQEGSAKLKVEGVQLASVIQAMARDVAAAKFGGTTSGTIDLGWSGTLAKSRSTFALEVAPPAQPTPDVIPVTAVLRADYDLATESMQLQQLSAATRATRINAAGNLGRANSKIDLSLNTTDLREFQPALATLGTGPIPVSLDGRASFNGTVVGTTRQPRLVGHLEVRDFDSVVSPPSKASVKNASAAGNASAGRPIRLHWDSLIADIDVSPSQFAAHHGVLQRGSSQLRFDGSTTLTRYRFTDVSRFTSTLDLSDATIAEVQSLAGYSYPVDGVLNLRGRIAGTIADLNGEGVVRVSNGTAYGETFQTLNADVRLAQQELQVTRLTLLQSAGGPQVAGTGTYNLQSKAFRFDLAGSDFMLARIRQLQTQQLQLAGIGDFHATGSGTPEAPVINAQFHLRELVVNGEAAGELDATAETHGPDLKLSARSHFQQASLDLDGTVRMREQWPGKIDFRFANFDFDPLLRSKMGSRLTGHSKIAGSLQLEGPMRQPRLLTARGDFSQLALEVENIKLQNDGPVRFTYANQNVQVEQLHIVGEGTDITGKGSVELAGERKLHLRGDGRINLKLLQYFDPDILSYGQTNAAMDIGGTLDKPDVNGKIEVVNAGVSLIDLPNGLSNINGTFVFNQNRLQVENLVARTGGGDLTLGGYITLERQPYFSLSAMGHDIRLRYPQGVSAVANADLKLTGTLKSSTLSGDVTVNRFGLNPRFNFALYLDLARTNQPSPTAQPNSLLNNLHLDVHVVTAPELQVQTSLAKVSGDADLRIRGTALSPVVLGRINVVEGDVFLNGTKYSLERGDILFANPVGIQPVLNLEATARVRDYDITVGFHGPVDKLTTTYRSDPPLPTGDIIALLALGRTREDAVVQSQNTSLTTSTSNAILGEALNATLSSRVQRIFGVSRIKIDPNSQQQDVGISDCRGFCVTIEQQVSDKVTLTYITNPSQAAQQIIQAEFNINRNLSIVAVRDQYGVVGFDVKWKQRKR
jgi:translocation and assembly module TamB